ncbi:DivIVA domain-containing protein [Psychromicrobium sp. YIM B11713]|uniref:DivIVA domain-containing protein n=1 Tax=Psychromicrobium sp. YIM B11713 TaxID=3145233 RepID=UPI00374FBF10
MAYLLVFLAVLLVGAVALFLIGQRRREVNGETMGAEVFDPSLSNALLDDGLAAPVPHLPPVLLPERPKAEDIDRIRFSLGLRGYRMDQVDQVLDRLSAELTRRDQRIADLEARVESFRPVSAGLLLSAAEQPPIGSAEPASAVPAGSEPASTDHQASEFETPDQGDSGQGLTGESR